MELVNQTPFEAEMTVSTDCDGADCLSVVVKASFDLRVGAEPLLSEEQDPVVLADTFHGEPGASSIREASDLCIDKPGTDLVLQGRAHAHRNGREADVTFRLGRHTKELKVFGDRVWDRVLGVAHKSRPEPFESIPLLWENAYGGWDTSSKNPKHHGCASDNPVGRGFRAKRSKLPIAGQPLPNLEHPRHPMKRPGSTPPPAGCGFVGRDWASRLRFAGTYDAAWERDRMPMLPRDFDPRYHDRAPEDLIAHVAPQAGEPVIVVGCDPDGVHRFALPAVKAGAVATLRRSSAELSLHCDTIAVDMERRKLVITSSAHHRIHGLVSRLVSVRVR